MTSLPAIIQGGMGAAVSSWRLARAVSSRGQLGVVSGTGLSVVVARRLQDGDRDGSVRRALAQFPFPDVAGRVLSRYFRADGRKPGEPYRGVSMPSLDVKRDTQELCVAANFAEVTLAREGHANPVGVNFLEKMQLMHLPSLYGAMLAGVDVVLVGAGIPVHFPAAIRALATHAPASYPIDVKEGPTVATHFDPVALFGRSLPWLQRPKFIAIVGSHVLAGIVLKRTRGEVDGFVVEGPSAGGHNAPPRGQMQIAPDGEPVYGERDQVVFESLRSLDRPFWLAGGHASAASLAEARSLGAAGVQVGTAFALCTESGLENELRSKLRDAAADGTGIVSTEIAASPTRLPFKVAHIDGTMSEAAVYAGRTRVCDIGFLRELYHRGDGSVGYRCPAEPEADYLAKGGTAADTKGRRCLCNALLANVGLPQHRRNGYREPALVTSGRTLDQVKSLVERFGREYSAADVLDHVLGTGERATAPAS